LNGDLDPPAEPKSGRAARAAVVIPTVATKLRLEKTLIVLLWIYLVMTCCTFVSSQ
jgi:hypothetical protein